MSELHPIYYDITEALLSTSAKRVQYYGIARTVIEIARHLATRENDVRFVVFSFGKKAFFEVKWHQNPNGDIIFDLPKDVDQRWSRSHTGNNILYSFFSRFKNIIANRRNEGLWEKNASNLTKVEVKTGIVVSAARPKLIVDMIKSIRSPGSDTKIVALLHDFMPLHRIGAKRFRSFDRNFLRDNQFVIENADLLLTNSQFTLDELDRFADRGILPKPGLVVTVPLVHECPQGTEKAEIVVPTQPYLLTVGLNLGRKNIEIVLESLRRMHRDGSTFPNLVIAGANRKRLKRYVERSEFAAIRDRIIFISNPNQTDLVRLYESALALVIPSYIEGWGLPAGEALWCGTPAVCSTAEVFREVCGDLGLYFNPDDADALSEIVRKLQSDSSFVTSLRERIAIAKPMLRNWNIVTVEILEALNHLNPLTTSVEKLSNPLADQGTTRYES